MQRTVLPFLAFVSRVETRLYYRELEKLLAQSYHGDKRECAMYIFGQWSDRYAVLVRRLFFFVIRKCEVYVSIKHRYQTVEQSTRISRRGHTAEDPKSPNTSRPKKFKYYRSHPRSLSRFPYLYLLEAPAIDHRDATFVQAAVKTLLEATGGLEDDGQLRMHLNLLQRALERAGNIICRKNF